MKSALIAPNAHYDMTHGQPKPIEKDNDGSTIVRLDINPETSESDGENTETAQIGWSCFEVRTFSTPTKANLKKAIIRAVVDETAEFDLVNSYNKHVMGIKVDEDAVANYKEFLSFTEELDTALVEMLNN